jgi:hypothetical protein
MQNIQLLTLALEDSQLYLNKLFLLQIDFTSAFNMVDHDKLLQIMYDLGFPVDAIENIKNIYTDAHITISTPFGPTNPIPFDRGTIQGDTLSPLLFLIFIEPLLRWLQVGDRGYHPGSTRQSPSDNPHHLPSMTFADDLNILSDSIPNLQIQARKVSLYSQWSSLYVNYTKSSVTGRIYPCHSTSPTILLPTQLKKLLTNTITIMDQTIPFLPPDSAFRFLGVHFDMYLNWTHHKTIIFNKANSDLSQLDLLKLSTNKKLYYIQSKIIPHITYAFPVVPYTDAELDHLDKRLRSSLKLAYGLQQSFATQLIQENKTSFGLGFPSLKVQYAHLNTKYLTLSLQDDSILQKLTHDLLHPQLQYLQGFDPMTLTCALNCNLNPRRLSLAKSAGISIIAPTNRPPLPYPPPHPILTLTQGIAAIYISKSSPSSHSCHLHHCTKFLTLWTQNITSYHITQPKHSLAPRTHKTLNMPFTTFSRSYQSQQITHNPSLHYAHNLSQQIPYTYTTP